uniref:Uncharacterized protein n=1 Tax=Anguilla anguilla TaxID=7936 RepID=A0A0E9XHG4_ANGAN
MDIYRSAQVFKTKILRPMGLLQ